MSCLKTILRQFSRCLGLVLVLVVRVDVLVLLVCLGIYSHICKGRCALS